jgi:hypothetical protein
MLIKCVISGIIMTAVIFIVDRYVLAWFGAGTAGIAGIAGTAKAAGTAGIAGAAETAGNAGTAEIIGTAGIAGTVGIAETGITASEVAAGGSGGIGALPGRVVRLVVLVAAGAVSYFLATLALKVGQAKRILRIKNIG